MSWKTPEEIEESKQRQREKDKFVADQLVSDLKKVLSTREGRRLIWGLIHTSGVHKRSAAPSGSDTYYNEGVRAMGTQLYNLVWDNMPELYLTMNNEAKEEEKNGY